SPLAIERKCRNSPRIRLVSINFHVVAVIRQTFAKAAETHVPRPRFLQHVLEIHAKSAHVAAAAPTLTAAAALVAVAANKSLLFCLCVDVAESRNVNPIRTIAKRHFVFMAWHRPGSSAPHVMIHYVVAKLSAAVAKPIRKFRRRRIEHQARRFQRRCAKKNNPPLKLKMFLRLCINYSQTGSPTLRQIENDAVHNAVRPNRKAPSLRGRRQRRIQTAEIRLRDAAAMAYAAVMTGRAALVNLRQNR